MLRRSAASPRLRRLLPIGVTMSLFVGAAACGDGNGGDGGDGRASSGSGVGAFPATVEHRYGTTEVPEAPERVVTLGLSDQDAVLALGVTLVAVTDWYGDQPSATWPWAQDELGDAEPEILNEDAFTGEQAFDYERIAALEPDLLIGLYTGMTEDEYDTLSEIAPTVAPSGGYPDYGMPWQETTRMVGQALGREDRAEELIAEVEQRFEEAAADHPEFEGREIVVAELFEEGVFARSATDPRTVFMTSLGFVLPDEIAELAGEEDGAEVSDEQLTLLDRDVLVWNVGFDDTARERIEGKPLYPRLEVVRAGRSVFIEDPMVSGALTWSTVLSLPYALEHVVPVLAETVGTADGRPG